MTEEIRKSIFLDGRSWPLFHGLASLFLLAILIFHWSPFDEYFDSRITAPMLYQAREELEKTPPLDPRIKIIALDDSSFSYLGGPRLTYPQLDHLLQNLAKKKPKAILIDSLLADIPQDAGTIAERRDGVAPVFTGNFLSSTKLRFRAEADMNDKHFQATAYLQGIYDLDHLPYALDIREDWHAYGHSAVYDGLINGTGHITYNRDGSISPFYRLGPKTLIPHMSLYAADSIRITEDGLMINNFLVPLNHAGRVLVNHRPPEDLYDRAITLTPILQRAMEKVDEPRIEEGDVVLILLAFATGNTDFHENGPFGDEPGGLMIAAMISDILNGTWLRALEYDAMFIILFGLLGILVGINLKTRSYVLVLIATWILFTAVVIALFVFKAIWCPWGLPLIAFTGTSIIHFVHVRIHEEMKLVLMEQNYNREKARRIESQREKAKVRYEGFGRRRKR